MISQNDKKELQMNWILETAKQILTKGIFTNKLGPGITLTLLKENLVVHIHQMLALFYSMANSKSFPAIEIVKKPR